MAEKQKIDSNLLRKSIESGKFGTKNVETVYATFSHKLPSGKVHEFQLEVSPYIRQTTCVEHNTIAIRTS